MKTTTALLTKIKVRPFKKVTQKKVAPTSPQHLSEASLPETLLSDSSAGPCWQPAGHRLSSARGRQQDEPEQARTRLSN